MVFVRVAQPLCLEVVLAEGSHCIADEEQSHFSGHEVVVEHSFHVGQLEYPYVRSATPRMFGGCCHGSDTLC